MQDNFTVLQKFVAMEEDVILDGVEDLGFAQVAYSTIETSPYENFALINKVLSDDELSEIEKAFQKLNRNPSVYFEKREDMLPLIESLQTQSYSKAHEDSWMFYTGETIASPVFDSVKKVENEEELALFVEIMDKSYGKDDPQNPFGALGPYLTIVKEGWLKHHQDNRLEYFLAFQEGKPVATASLNNFKGIGYISNVGSIREVRGQGFAKKTTLSALVTSIKNGNKTHCLTTEEGTYPNEFYKRLGFTTKFIAICYSRNT